MWFSVCFVSADLTMSVHHRSQQLPGPTSSVHPNHPKNLQEAQAPQDWGGKHVGLAACRRHHCHWRDQHYDVWRSQAEEKVKHRKREENYLRVMPSKTLTHSSYFLYSLCASSEAAWKIRVWGGPQSCTEFTALWGLHRAHNVLLLDLKPC